MPYAVNTSVPAERSRAEIEATIARYGAESFAIMTDAKRTVIGFKCQRRTIRFDMPAPEPPETVEKWGKPRELSDAEKYQFVADESRRRWRSLLLVIKAKLEAVESGIATFENEFLAYTVMPNGQTVGEWAKPQLDASKKLPPMLGSGEE